MLKIFGIVLSILFLVAVIYVVKEPISFINSFGSYKTQTILYRNKENPDVTIEFQMKDIGALGYKKRVVKIEPGIFGDSAKPIDVSDINLEEWLFLNKDVNEHGLKY